MDTYEKKYNYLVNDLKELWNCHTNDSQLLGELAEIFPELAESEDERIRRTLVEYFGPQVQLDFVRGVPIQKIRDWLEKQKEQKPIQPNIKREYIEKRLKGLIDKKGEYYRGAREELAHLYYILGGQPSQYLINNVAKEEQKPEEKSINWTELTWKDIDKLESIINNVHYEFRNGIGQESFGKEVLEKFREYKGDEYLDEIEQKPAEWSEEDEKMRNLIVAIFEVNHPDGFFKANEFGTTDMRGVHTEEIISWLKSLRSQLSDED